MRNNKFLVPAITGLAIIFTLALTIIVKSGTPFELTLLLAYVGIGIIGFGYSALLEKIKMPLASDLFLILTIGSGIYFYMSMPEGPEGLSQFAAFLGWLLLMAISVVLSLIVGLIAGRIKQ